MLKKYFDPKLAGNFYFDDIRIVKALSQRMMSTFINPTETFLADGSWTRGVSSKYGKLLIKVHPTGMVSWVIENHLVDHKLIENYISDLFQIIDLSLIKHGKNHLIRQSSVGTGISLVHVRSPNLFEALAKAVIRQVIRAPQAKLQIETFCTQFGETLSWENTNYIFFPEAEAIRDIHENQLKKIKLGYKAKIIKNIADEIHSLESCLDFSRESDTDILNLLQTIKGIGEWSSRIVIADFWGRWDNYPFDDLAVRTMARHYMPDYPWESNPRSFKVQWQELFGTDVGKVTFFVLSGL